MRHTLAIVMLTGFLVGLQPQAVPDLSKVDRTIVKEPSNLSQPGYCLMVFGPRAEVRIWMIKDGERLYVDRNANGDLTEPDESLCADRAPSVQYDARGQTRSVSRAQVRRRRPDAGPGGPQAYPARNHPVPDRRRTARCRALGLCRRLDQGIRRLVAPLSRESPARWDRPFWRADERAADIGTGRSAAARPARSSTSGSARRGSSAPHSPRSPMRPCPKAFTPAPRSNGHVPIRTPLRSKQPSFCRGGVDTTNSRAPCGSQAARPTAWPGFTSRFPDGTGSTSPTHHSRSKSKTSWACSQIDELGHCRPHSTDMCGRHHSRSFRPMDRLAPGPSRSGPKLW